MTTKAPHPILMAGLLAGMTQWPMLSKIDMTPVPSGHNKGRKFTTPQGKVYKIRKRKSR